MTMRASLQVCTSVSRDSERSDDERRVSLEVPSPGSPSDGTPLRARLSSDAVTVYHTRTDSDTSEPVFSTTLSLCQTLFGSFILFSLRLEQKAPTTALPFVPQPRLVWFSPFRIINAPPEPGSTQLSFFFFLFLSEAQIIILGSPPCRRARQISELPCRLFSFVD